MTHSTTVLDCREQCAKFEAECSRQGGSAAKCRDERRRGDRNCIFK